MNKPKSRTVKVGAAVSGVAVLAVALIVTNGIRGAKVEAGEVFATPPGTVTATGVAYPGAAKGKLFTYPLPGGSYLAVDGAAALPAKVLQDLALQGAGALSGVSEPAARTAAYRQYAAYSQAVTGKRVLLVAVVGGADTRWAFWATTGDQAYRSSPGPRAGVVKQADALAAADRTGRSVVVVTK